MASRESAVRILATTFGGYRRDIVILVVLGTLAAALDGLGITAIVPLLSFLMGSVAMPGDFLTRMTQSAFSALHVPFQFRYLIAFIVIIFFVRAGMLVIFNLVRGSIIARYMGTEVTNLYAAVLGARWDFILRQKAGYLHNTIFWDARRGANLLDSVVQLIQSGTGFCMYLLIALNISPLLTTLTILGGGLMLLFFQPLVARSRRYAEASAAAEKQLVHELVETTEGFKSVKAAHASHAVLANAKRAINSLTDAYTKNIFLQTSSTALIQPLGFVFLLGLFAVMYRSGGFNLPAFAATLYLIQKIFTYLQSAQSSFHNMAEMIPLAANTSAFKKTVRSQTEADEGSQPFSFGKELRLEHVSLVYEGGTAALRDVSLTVHRGEMVGIVGPSGGGKTSLADIILRLFKPSAGTMHLDGIPADAVSLAEWRSHIAYVSQQSFLFNGTIADNIRFYRDIPERNLIEAMRQANILAFVEGLPEGMNTMIGDRGVFLSGGQRQRVALARALAGDLSLLVLDEATSALDAESEELIQESIRTLHGSVSMIIIAHRVSTVLGADRIIVLEKGAVIEMGKPADMLARDESYLARMRTLQQKQPL